MASSYLRKTSWAMNTCYRTIKHRNVDGICSNWKTRVNHYIEATPTWNVVLFSWKRFSSSYKFIVVIHTNARARSVMQASEATHCINIPWETWNVLSLSICTIQCDGLTHTNGLKWRFHRCLVCTSLHIWNRGSNNPRWKWAALRSVCSFFFTTKCNLGQYCRLHPLESVHPGDLAGIIILNTFLWLARI